MYSAETVLQSQTISSHTTLNCWYHNIGSIWKIISTTCI